MSGYQRAKLFTKVVARLLGLLTILLCLPTTLAKAQGWAIQGQAVDSTGKPLKFALVRVCPYTSSGLPCSPLTPTIWSDIPETHPVSNPYTTDATGNYSFVVTTGQSYLVQVFVGSSIIYSYLYTAGTATATVVEVNNTPISPASPADFVDTSSVHWIFTGGHITATSTPGTSLALQHNGTPLVDQALLNFNDTTPGPPLGSQSVTFQTDSGGDLSGYVSGAGTTFQMTPPLAANQYVLYPTTFTGGGSAPVIATAPASIVNQGFCIFGGAATLQASGFTLLPWMHAANVTVNSVFAFSSDHGNANSGTCFGNPVNPGPLVMAPFQATATGVGSSGLVPNSGAQTSDGGWGLQLVTAAFTPTAANIPSTVITATGNASLGFSAGGAFFMPSEGLIVTDTIDTPPANNAVIVQPCLTFVSNTLGVDPRCPFPGQYLYPYTVAQAKLEAGNTLPQAPLWIYDGISQTDCATGGGTFKVLCVFDGQHTLTAWAGGGGGSGTIATTPNILKGDNAGNAIASTATNPTCSGCAGGIGLGQGTLPPNVANQVTLTVPASVTNYRLQFPGVQPSGANTFLSCTSADPAVCSWAAGGSGSSPLTTKGDLYGFDTTNNRIPVGSNGQVLTADSTNALGVSWQAGGSGGTTLTDNILVNSPSTGLLFVEADSIGLIANGGFPEDLATLLLTPSGNQKITAIGSGMLADMLSCNTAGAGKCTQDGTWPLTFPLGITTNTRALLEPAYNDLSFMSSTPTNPQLSYYFGGLKAWALEFGIPDSEKIAANNTTYCTTTGTWTAATSVPGNGTFPAGTLQTSTPGATMVCTKQNATDAGIIGLKTAGSTTATFTVSVVNAGTTYNVSDPYTGSTTLNQTAAYTSLWGAPSNFYAVGQASLAGGYTTVTLTAANNSSDPVYVVAPYFLSPSSSLQNAPAVEIMLESRAGCNGTCSSIDGAHHNDTNTNLMRTAQMNVANEFRSNGLNISYYDPNATPVGFNSSDGTQSSDGTHPNSTSAHFIANTAFPQLNSAATTQDHFLPTPAQSSTNYPGCVTSGLGAITCTTSATANAGIAAVSTNASGSVQNFFQAQGAHQFALASWGSGNGAGLGGVFGLFDVNNVSFPWVVNSTSDLFGNVPVTNVSAGTGAAWGISHTGAASFSTIIVSGIATSPSTSPICPNGTGGAFTTSGCGGVVSSVFTRTGAVVAISGDYTVGQVTGAAPLASPTFTGTPAAPTATGGTSTTQLATTAFVQAAVAAAASGAGIVTYSGPALTLSGTQYLPIGGGGLASTTETNVDLDSPAAATIQNFSVQMSAAPGVGNSVVYTWRKNAASTALTCTISGASATNCSDTTHSFSVVAADLMDIQAVTTGTIAGTPTLVMGTQFGIAASSGVSSLAAGFPLLASAATGAVTISAPAVETNILSDGVLPTGCTISGNVCTVGTATNSVTFSSIPAIDGDLEIIDMARASDSADRVSIGIQFNGDTSTDYGSNQLFGINGTAGAGPVATATSGTICIAPANTAPTNLATGCTIVVYGYAGTLFAKNFWGASSSFGSTTVTTNWLDYDAKGMWTATPAAITAIKLIDLSGGNFVVGTTFRLRVKP